MKEKGFTPYNNNIRGFTLIELLIVLALIAILIAILVLVIKPAQIFMKGRDAQRQGDLRNLSQAVDAYLTEAAINPSLNWCLGNTIRFSYPTATPYNWPTPSGATGSTSTLPNNNWTGIDFTLVPVINLSQVPLDPRNGVVANAATGTAAFVYAFACDSSYNYKFAAKLEGNLSAMIYDGGKSNCDTVANCLYEIGPGKATLY